MSNDNSGGAFKWTLTIMCFLCLIMLLVKLWPGLKVREINVPQVKGGVPVITQEYVDKVEDHVIVIQTGDWQYITIDHATFCNRSNQFFGVFNHNTGTWTARTSTQ